MAEEKEKSKLEDELQRVRNINHFVGIEEGKLERQNKILNFIMPLSIIVKILYNV